MTPPIASQILFALGGKSLTSLGTLPWRKGLQSRGGEIAYTLTRADATTCATYIDYDSIIRIALANVARVEWADLDGDGVRETPGLLLEGSRTNTLLQSQALATTWVPNLLTPTNNVALAPDSTPTATGLVPQRSVVLSTE